MAENTMRVGYAPITGTIYAGRLNAAGASFYSGDTIAEMNEAPQQARQALAAHWKSLAGEKS